MVVALLRRDADNLAVAMLAKEAGAGRTMVRMREADIRPFTWQPGYTAFYRDRCVHWRAASRRHRARGGPQRDGARRR